MFGSRAREEQGEYADLDVAALVDVRTPDLEQRLDDAAYDVMWAFDFSPIISLKVFEETRFNTAVSQGLPLSCVAGRNPAVNNTVRRYLINARKTREVADYDIDEDVGAAMAEVRLEEAHAFVDAIAALLNQRNGMSS